MTIFKQLFQHHSAGLCAVNVLTLYFTFTFKYQHNIKKVFSIIVFINKSRCQSNKVFNKAEFKDTIINSPDRETSMRKQLLRDSSH